MTQLRSEFAAELTGVLEGYDELSRLTAVAEQQLAAAGRAVIQFMRTDQTPNGITPGTPPGIERAWDIIDADPRILQTVLLSTGLPESAQHMFVLQMLGYGGFIEDSKELSIIPRIITKSGEILHRRLIEGEHFTRAQEGWHLTWVLDAWHPQYASPDRQRALAEYAMLP